MDPGGDALTVWGQYQRVALTERGKYPCEDQGGAALTARGQTPVGVQGVALTIRGQYPCGGQGGVALAVKGRYLQGYMGCTVKTQHP